MNIYSIQDNAADFFIAPYMAQNHNHAKRMFIASLGDSFPHRKDFTLFCLGEFDADTGIVTGLPAPSLVLAGLSVPPDLDPRVGASPLHGVGSYPDVRAELPTKELQS